MRWVTFWAIFFKNSSGHPAYRRRERCHESLNENVGKACIAQFDDSVWIFEVRKSATSVRGETRVNSSNPAVKSVCPMRKMS
jgi:hypothetical protein